MNKQVVISAFAFLFCMDVSSAECNIEQGKRVFNKCASCHSLQAETHMMGPSLYGVVGRKAGSAVNFLYSVAMEQSGITWSEEKLKDFLHNPMKYVTGTSMPFGGLMKADDRDAVVCYIRSYQ